LLLRESVTAPGPQPPTPLHILLVEDDARARALIATALERRGHRVTCAEELDEAGALLAFRDYDVLCLDLDLTGLDGLEGLDLIGEAHARRPGLRILVETGNASSRVHAACRDRGAAAIYVKGSPLVELQALVESRTGGER
jgi:DNA-binding response OmpR family regulator